MLRIERRADARFNYFAEVQLKGKDEIYYHRAANLSIGGLFLKTEFPLPEGTRLELRLRQKGKPDIEVEGKVSWIRTGPWPPTMATQAASTDAPSGMGIAFGEMTPGTRERIEALVGQLAGLPTSAEDAAPESPDEDASPARRTA